MKESKSERERDRDRERSANVSEIKKNRTFYSHNKTQAVETAVETK